MKKKTCYQKPVIDLVEYSASDILVASGDDTVNDFEISDLFTVQQS